jgi:hypothetical protein
MAFSLTRVRSRLTTKLQKIGVDGKPVGKPILEVTTEKREPFFMPFVRKCFGTFLKGVD